MNNSAAEIRYRLSLRKPQVESLEILSSILDVLTLKKDENLEIAKEKIKALSAEFDEIKKFCDFERNFPNICFSLATGVGKTRLMGAFISYLHIAKGINNFFVLAPNLTIYNKLIDDMSNTANPKYVFRGINCFAVNEPYIITGENYNKQHNILTNDMLKKVKINIFNISKINAETDRKSGLPRIKKLSEYLGESYFDYLKNLPDLVLLMDESHHYRAQTSSKTLNELNPLLGIELTATPQVEYGSKTTKFKNVVYEYSLPKAMNDGFIKEPAVATRKNFDPAQLDIEELDRLKLKDGIKIHQNTKADLMIYSRDNNVKPIKPFVLVVAKDTAHAQWIEKEIKSDNFFSGYYKDKVMQIHSGQKGAEKDENISKLLSLEEKNNKIEIVIHVNMLKEGWDVTNLYTIIPLRTAASTTLREQTIGRGLRLPYGKKTGNKNIDTLTIIAHDKFQEIIEEARKYNSIIKKENIIEIDDEDLKDKKEIITTVTQLDYQKILEKENIEKIANEKEKEEAKIIFEAQNAIEDAVFKLANSGFNLNSMEDEKIIYTAKREAAKNISKKAQTSLFDTEKINKIEEKIEENLNRTKEKIENLIIEIPKITFITEEIKTSFEDFNLDTEELNLKPIGDEILRKTLRQEEIDTIKTFIDEKTDLKNILMTELSNISEVDYKTCSKLLYKLSTQAIEKLSSYLSQEDVQNVVLYRRKDVTNFIKKQLMAHFKKEEKNSGFWEVKAFSKILEHNSYKFENDKIYNYRETITPKEKIPTLLFNGFKKALHGVYKFDSKTEKDFSIILEDDNSVIKWMKPAFNQFDIFWQKGRYVADFVVECDDCVYLIETKKEKELNYDEVQLKARAAFSYCKNATEFNLKNKGKPWIYILLPHNCVTDNMGFDYLVKQYEYKP